jgi:tetratricopeptide (TPR) repeat protein
MVHNDEPYRVSVEVRGKRFTASIEGQEVESWTDDAPAVGAVGFFAEAGERARIYWMKVSRNDDWLGRVCAFLAGGAGNGEIAWISARDRSDSGHVPPPGAPDDRIAGFPILGMLCASRRTRALSKAASFRARGKPARAVNLLRKTIANGDGDGAVFGALGQTQYELGDYRAAAASYRQSAEAEPQSPAAKFNMGLCLAAIADWAGAAGAFQQALHTDSSCARAQLGLSVCLLHGGAPKQARKLLEQYLDLFPEDEQALYANAVALHMAGEIADACVYYRKVLATNPLRGEALENLVSMYLGTRQYSSVKLYAEQLLKTDPESALAPDALAALAFSEGDLAGAAGHCRRLTALVPERFEVWFNLGVACQQLGSFAEAADAYERAAGMRPESGQTWLNLGFVRQALGEAAAAVNCYQRALSCGVGQPEAMWNLALILEKQGETDLAEKLYGAIPENADEWVGATFRRGCLEFFRGDYKASAQSFETCARLRSGWIEAYLNAGVTYLRLSRKADARRWFEATLLLRPDSADAIRGLAALAMEERDYPRALALHRRLLAMGDDSPEVQYNVEMLTNLAERPAGAGTAETALGVTS